MVRREKMPPEHGSRNIGWDSGTYDDERREESVRRSWKLMSRGSRQMSVELTSKRIAQGCVNI